MRLDDGGDLVISPLTAEDVPAEATALKLSPRIRDLGKITLYRAGSRAQIEADFPHTGPLLTRKLNTDLIAEH